MPKSEVVYIDGSRAVCLIGWFLTGLCLYIHWGSLVTLELISLIPLVGYLEVNPLAVKLLNNRLYICGMAQKIVRVPNTPAFSNIKYSP